MTKKRVKLSYTCKIDSKGRAVGPNAERIRPDLVSFFSGQFVTITIEGLEKEQSDDMREYYHAVVVPMLIDALIDAGHDINKTDRDEVREARRAIEKMIIERHERISKIIEVNIIGQKIERFPDMKELNGKDYGDIMDDIISFMKDFLGVREVPKPRRR